MVRFCEYSSFILSELLILCIDTPDEALSGEIGGDLSIGVFGLNEALSGENTECWLIRVALVGHGLVVETIFFHARFRCSLLAGSFLMTVLVFFLFLNSIIESVNSLSDKKLFEE